MHSQGSPLGKEGRHWGTRRHKCTIGAHHWGGRGRRRRKRRHRRRHKCTILNHHSFVRSLILSLASALSRLTTGEGRVHTGRHTQPPFVARSLARQIHCHTVRPFARSFANSRLALATGEREITHGHHRSLVCSPTTARHWGMRRHKCTLRAHHWGRRGHRRSKRRHRRRHKCTILNHHSFVRSLVRSLASALSRLTTGEGRVTGDTGGDASAPYSTTIRSLVRSFARSLANSWLTAHHWGGRGSQARHTPPSLARLLANSGLTAHHWGRRVATGERGDTSALSGLTTGEGSQAAQEATQEATQVHHTQPPFVRSLARQCALTVHHWGGRGRRRATLRDGSLAR